MSRFEREIKGLLGEYWKKDAEKQVAKIREEFEAGEITVDENGVARNCIGRILMDDLAEVLEYAKCCEWFSREATEVARTNADKEFIREYKAAQAQRDYSQEELFEMRAAFGTGTTIVDVLTGKEITL